MGKPSTFDCFCGLGGLSLGADLAGFEVVGGVDSDATAIAVYQRAFPSALALQEDLLKVRPRTVLRAAGLSRGDVDVLLGGPPCQPYSINNHQRGTDDARFPAARHVLRCFRTSDFGQLVVGNDIQCQKVRR